MAHHGADDVRRDRDGRHARGEQLVYLVHVLEAGSAYLCLEAVYGKRLYKLHHLSHAVTVVAHAVDVGRQVVGAGLGGPEGLVGRVDAGGKHADALGFDGRDGTQALAGDGNLDDDVLAAANLRDAKKMAALARKHGILLLTNYETTWYAANRFVRQEVEAGKLGPLYRIEIYDGHQGPIEIGCSKKFTDWLTDPVLNGGGAVMDFGCYGANLATWLLKGQRPARVYAVLQHNKPEVYPKVDDDATIVLDYPGTTVQINASWCWPYGRKDMYVYGKDACLYQADPKRVARNPGQPALETPALDAPYDNPFHYLAAAVRGEIRVSPTDLSSLENNLTVMEILSAAVRSARKGTPVKL